MKKLKLVLGSRGSALAKRQLELVEKALLLAHPEIVIEKQVISTRGDRGLAVNLLNNENVYAGLFTKDLEVALVNKQIDIAVHSLKDLPLELATGTLLVAILPRGGTEDVLISRSPGGWKSLKEKAFIGTGSPRRAMQIKLLRDDFQVKPIAGNVPTRIDKLAKDTLLDGIVLAKVGLDRLNLLSDNGKVVFEDDRGEEFFWEVLTDFLPSPGQGAIAIQSLSEDKLTVECLATIHDPVTARCVEAERSLLRLLGGGCRLPLGALSTQEDRGLRLRAVWDNGKSILRADVVGTNPDDVAKKTFIVLCNQNKT